MKEKSRILIVTNILVAVLVLLTFSLAFAGEKGPETGREAVEFGTVDAVPQSAGGGTMCTGGGAAVGIIHDDGNFENGYSGNPATISNFNIADLFNPVGPSYDYTRFCVGLVSLGGPDLSFEIVFWDNDGPGGTPGTELGSVPANATGIPGGLPCGWYEYDLTGVGGIPNGADGDIYIGVRYNPMTYPSRFTCSDESPGTPLWTGYVNFNAGVGWQPINSSFPNYRAMSTRVEMTPQGPAPNITIDKSPASQNVVMGGDAVFTITVTNTGDVDLTNVSVSDALVPDCDVAIGSLAVSATVSYGCTDVGVINSYTNVVTVTSEYSGGLPGPSALDTADVTVLVPDINVTPNNLSSSQFADEIMTDTTTIENNGNLTLNWTLDEAPSDCNSPADVTWASATPTSGSIPGSGSTDVEVTFDSTGLSPGIYTGKLCIDSDDPDEPTVEVNLTLTVVVADINLNPTSLSSTQFMNEVMTETLAIESQGTGPLTWSISEAGSDCNSPGDVSWVNVSPTGGTTNSGGSTNVDVGFDSTGLAHGVYTAKLCVDSNDPDEPQVEADLTLTVEERPIIMVSPGSLGGTLPQNEMMTQTLTISNTGDADLDWLITEGSSVMEGGCGTPGNLSWVSVSPSSGSTPPGNSNDIAVVFDPTGLATGDYSGELCITSDAPDNPEVVVTLNLTVVEAEYFIYLPAVRRVDTTSADQPVGLVPIGMLFFFPAAVFTWHKWGRKDF